LQSIKGLQIEGALPEIYGILTETYGILKEAYGTLTETYGITDTEDNSLWLRN
jgi:hypothetical protein